jgi:hypothetical protein
MSTTLPRPDPNTLRVSQNSFQPLAANVADVFCSTCTTKALQSPPLCPIDRSPLATEDVKPAPKIVSDLVNELCPRACGVECERECLPRHMRGNCELEEIACVCGASIPRRERKWVIEAEGIEGVVPVPCAHEWLACSDCTARFERRHRKVAATPKTNSLHIAKPSSQTPSTPNTTSNVPSTPSPAPTHL